MSTGAIVGIVVGGVVGILLIAIIAWIWATYNKFIRMRNDCDEAFLLSAFELDEAFFDDADEAFDSLFFEACDEALADDCDEAFELEACEALPFTACDNKLYASWSSFT